ncbi:MAG TPA: hypothetical protein VFY65_20160 [Longimicrobium sp.]|nr:hypothetical protein [Longimicrobium sp.]
MRNTRSCFHASVLLVPLLAAACGKGSVAPGDYTAVQCGQGTSQSRAAEIGQQGGTVSVADHSLIVPPEALNGRVPFTITEIPGGYLGVELGPDGTRFARNATLRLSFARCGGNPAGFSNLRVVQVERGTARIIRVLPSTVDTQARTVTTTGLDHLSGYLISGT